MDELMSDEQLNKLMKRYNKQNKLLLLMVMKHTEILGLIKEQLELRGIDPEVLDTGELNDDWRGN
jgi:hypothetical protein